MLKINMSWKSPIYNEIYSDKLHRTVRFKEEHCKKNLLLNVDIKGLCRHISEDIMLHLVDRINEEAELALDDGEKLLLSNQSWGVSAVYNESTHTYTDVICLPKDFDDVDVQKKLVMKLVRALAKELKYEYATYSREADDMHYSYEVAF